MIFFKKLTRNFNAMKDLINIKKNKCYSKIFDFNTVYEIPKNLLKNQLIDIIVTSPPYGDSKTTVAYGQYSKLSSDWLDIRDTNQIDNLIMGGKTKKEINNFGNEKLDKVIKDIETIDIKRAQEVNSFFYDYQNSIQNVSAYMKKGSIAAYVVGNRRVKGIDIPMDEATSYFFERNHFSHIETIIREIPNKRMPSKNSPSNVIGKKDSTMVNEYIVVMKKK
jgi:tRNA G10  N-methylase Trm11